MRLKTQLRDKPNIFEKAIVFLSGLTITLFIVTLILGFLGLLFTIGLIVVSVSGFLLATLYVIKKFKNYL